MSLVDLFRWKRKVDVVDNNGKVLDTVWVRLIGDADYQEARTRALRESKKMRLKLKDEKSDEYISTFLDVDSMNKEELIGGIVMSEMGDYRDEAILRMTPQLPPELPDNPTLEQQEEHQTAMDKLRQERIKQITDFMEKRGEERRQELIKLEDKDLRELYKTSTINLRCTEVFIDSVRGYSIYKGTFTDPKCTKPAFSSFDEYLNASPSLKSQLISAYNALEINGEDLKN